jgi:hypothetical protein
MKLLLQGNSLRLRLSQSEVAQFSKTGFVEEGIQFEPGANFAYTLESMSSLSAPQAVFSNGCCASRFPAPKPPNGPARTALACRANRRSHPANAWRC